MILVLFFFPMNNEYKKFTKYKKNVTRVRNKAFEVVDVAKEERVWTSTPVQYLVLIVGKNIGGGGDVDLYDVGGDGGGVGGNRNINRVVKMI